MGAFYVGEVCAVIQIETFKNSILICYSKWDLLKIDEGQVIHMLSAF